MVESYQDIAFDGAFKGRVRALWGCAAVGLALGAATGLGAPVFPALAGASIGLGEVAKSVAIFSAIGMTTGFGIGATVGNSAAAAATVAQEQERRLRAQAAEHGVAAEQAPAKAEPAPLKRLGQKLGDPKDSYFNAKVAVAFAAIGAAAGLVMAGAFYALGGETEAAGWAMPAMKALLGEAAKDTTVVTAYFAGVMATFGASMGINVPKLATNFTHYAGDLLSGKALGTSFSKEPAQEAVVTKDCGCGQKLDSQIEATNRQFASYQELVAQQQSSPNAEWAAKR